MEPNPNRSLSCLVQVRCTSDLPNNSAHHVTGSKMEVVSNPKSPVPEKHVAHGHGRTLSMPGKRNGTLTSKEGENETKSGAGETKLLGSGDKLSTGDNSQEILIADFLALNASQCDATLPSTYYVRFWLLQIKRNPLRCWECSRGCQLGVHVGIWRPISPLVQQCWNKRYQSTVILPLRDRDQAL